MPVDRTEHLFDTWRVGYVKPPSPWEAGRQAILNSTGARVPEHTFGQPVPVVARIVWEHDGEEHIEIVAPPCGSTPQMPPGVSRPGRPGRKISSGRLDVRG